MCYVNNLGLANLLKIYNNYTLPLPSNKVKAFVGLCDVSVFSTYINEEFDQIKHKL